MILIAYFLSSLLTFSPLCSPVRWDLKTCDDLTFLNNIIWLFFYFLTLLTIPWQQFHIGIPLYRILIIYNWKYFSGVFPKLSTRFKSTALFIQSNWYVFSLFLYAASWSAVIPWRSAWLTEAPWERSKSQILLRA